MRKRDRGVFYRRKTIPGILRAETIKGLILTRRFFYGKRTFKNLNTGRALQYLL